MSWQEQALRDGRTPRFFLEDNSAAVLHAKKKDVNQRPQSTGLESTGLCTQYSPGFTGLYPWLPTGRSWWSGNVNYSDVTTEVVDRMLAIGTLGQRVAEDRLAPAEALELAEKLIQRARAHLTNN